MTKLSNKALEQIRKLAQNVLDIQSKTPFDESTFEEYLDILDDALPPEQLVAIVNELLYLRACNACQHPEAQRQTDLPDEWWCPWCGEDLD